MAATLAANGKLWDCETCRSQGLTEMRFCKQDAPFPIYEIDDALFFRCPVQAITDDSMTALMEYGFYQDGFLPNGNGFDMQDNRWLEQILIIRGVVNESIKQRRAQ